MIFYWKLVCLIDGTSEIFQLNGLLHKANAWRGVAGEPVWFSERDGDGWGFERHIVHSKRHRWERKPLDGRGVQTDWHTALWTWYPPLIINKISLCIYLSFLMRILILICKNYLRVTAPLPVQQAKCRIPPAEPFTSAVPSLPGSMKIQSSWHSLKSPMLSSESPIKPSIRLKKTLAWIHYYCLLYQSDFNAFADCTYCKISRMWYYT